ncbi:fructosamine kinase family protein, partial [Salmonella enterica subsp. enterica serovar Minnesota]|uniref:fructosamine kinase family protein n=1 Tax=Salmonella enterica TaxID=28901 RepID=UPI003D26E587
ELGARLAHLHRVRADRHGFDADNYIGASPQANGWLADWVEFLRARRLGPQLAAVDEAPGADPATCAHLRERGARLLEAIDVFYGSY